MAAAAAAAAAAAWPANLLAPPSCVPMSVCVCIVRGLTSQRQARDNYHNWRLHGGRGEGNEAPIAIV